MHVYATIISENRRACLAFPQNNVPFFAPRFRKEKRMLRRPTGAGSMRLDPLHSFRALPEMHTYAVPAASNAPSARNQGAWENTPSAQRPSRQ